jgi:hypothetical protein
MAIGGLAVAMLLATTGCSGSPTDAALSTGTSVPGTASVTLAANPNDAAALSFAITGGEIEEVRASGDGLVYWETVGGTTRVVAVYPRPATGVLFTIDVPDKRILNQYSVRIEEAADTWDDLSDEGAVSVQLN